MTDALVNDWGAHLKWIGLFVIGLLAARQDRFWALMEAHRGKALAIAAILLAIQCRINDPAWSVISGLYAWAAICALCGFARAWLNQPSPVLSHLNAAVLPVYVLHQPIMLVTAFWLFPLRLPLGVEVGLLVAVTGLGSFGIYEVFIRRFGVMRFLFGLKPRLNSTGPRSDHRHPGARSEPQGPRRLDRILRFANHSAATGLLGPGSQRRFARDDGRGGAGWKDCIQISLTRTIGAHPSPHNYDRFPCHT
jgi:hypothetical protein